MHHCQTRRITGVKGWKTEGKGLVAHLEQVVAVADELGALLVPGKGVAATLPPPSLHPPNDFTVRSF